MHGVKGTSERDGQPSVPDYELQDQLELVSPDQFKAMGDPLRHRILGLLGQRAATTSQLAEALQVPVGTMGHHLRVLVDAGLIHVVRTRRVRAMTEKYYGRVARAFYSLSDEARLQLLRQSMQEYVPTPASEVLPLYVLRYVRVTQDRAEEFARRLSDLVMEFETEGPKGEHVYGVLGALYQTDWPAWPDGKG